MKEYERIIDDMNSRVVALEEWKARCTMEQGRGLFEEELKPREVVSVRRTRSNRHSSLTVNIGSPLSSEMSGENNQEVEEEVQAQEIKSVRNKS